MAIHFILQSKGGIGKTYIASLMIQYFKSKNKNVVGIDIDPSTPTLSQFEDLKVERVELIKKSGKNNSIIQRDDFNNLARVIENKAYTNADFVVDCGASGYPDVKAFLAGEEILDYFKTLKQPVYFHSILKGGEEKMSTIEEMTDLMRCFPTVPFIVWLNEFQSDGKVLLDGHPFEDFQVYQEEKDHIIDVIRVPEMNAACNVYQQFYSQHKTIRQASKDRLTTLLEQMRLNQYHRTMWALFDQMTDAVAQYEARLAAAETTHVDH